MSENDSQANTVAPSLGFKKFLSASTGSDVAFAIGVMAIIMMLIMPMSSWFLDMMLAVSMTFSIIVMMTVLFIQKPLEFSAFPTVLLVATLLRLSLNLSSTRLILDKGHEGSAAAGRVIEAFGSFLMGGSPVIGIIVFAILVIVNFMVITKGSGRIAEVAARFSLDAMPGKQMAIDADLSSGILGEQEAKSKRKELEDESVFFGSMDGASKFVRGDAIAGILITFINIIGGIVIGVVMNDMSFGDAANRYTVLTVGDGLVSQIPALIVSTSAGLLVTKAGVTGSTDKALFGQIGANPRALALGGVVMTIMGILPGLPFLPFGFMGVILFFFAFTLNKNAEDIITGAAEKARVDKETATPIEEPITSALAIDQVRLELGYGLLPLINEDSGFRLTDQIKALRRQMASDMGFIMPSVRILDNMQLEPNTYVLRIKETETGRGDVRPGMLMCMDPRGEPVTIPGEVTTEPAFGLPAVWVDKSSKEDASFRGYTVVDPATVIVTHLTEVIKDNMPDLLSYAETQNLLEDLPPNHQKLITDLIPNLITTSSLQRVLQNLLAERISIRDLPAILEGVAEATGYTQNIIQITEHVRSRLSRQISAANSTSNGSVPLVTLSPEWEQSFAESLIGQGEDRQLAMAPSQLQDFIGAVRVLFDEIAQQGESPVLLTSPLVRPYVRSIIERFRPSTVVMSQNEIHPKAKIRTLGQV